MGGGFLNSTCQPPIDKRITPCYIALHGEKGLNMAKIQIDLSPEEDRIVEVYKLMNNLKTKQEAIKRMVTYFKVEIKPKNIAEKDYYST